MYALSKPFSEIAKPELADYYWSTVHPQWFVSDPKSVDAKTPGMTLYHHFSKIYFKLVYKGFLKNELTMTHGSFIGLSPKCYSILNHDDEELTQAKKGVNNATPIQHEAYVNALYNDNNHLVQLPRFNFCKKSNEMKLILQQKNALNANLTKRFVLEDRVRTVPLMINGQYI